MKVISLGNNCDIAQMLRYNNLRKEGYPFDWIWTSIDFLIETFTTDYFVFTECEKLICKSEFNGNSDTYVEYNNNNNNSYNELSSNNKLIKAISVHDADNMKNENELREKIVEINEKYKRKFERLYSDINNEDKILFVRKISPANEIPLDNTTDTIEKIEELYRLLISKFKCKIIICILDEKGVLMNNLERKKYNIDNNTINIDNNIFIFNCEFILIRFIHKHNK